MTEPCCLFCEMIAGRKSSSVIYEDKEFFCVLDHKPLFYGHSLLMPKKHYTTYYDLPSSVLELHSLNIQKIGKAIEEAMHAKGTFIAMNNIVSQSIPHLHVHIVPRNFKDGLKGFFWPRQKYIDEQHVLKIQSSIQNALKKNA